jgi:hypothetical protein
MPCSLRSSRILSPIIALIYFPCHCLTSVEESIGRGATFFSYLPMPTERADCRSREPAPKAAEILSIKPKTLEARILKLGATEMKSISDISGRF